MIGVQPTVSNFNRPSRCGAACFALIFIALTATTVLAQRPTPAPQRPVTPASNVQLPAELASRVTVAQPIVDKGFSNVQIPGNNPARPQVFTTAARSQILEAAKSGNAQSAGNYVIAQRVTGGNGLATTQLPEQIRGIKRQAPLADLEKVAILKHIMSAGGNTLNLARIPTTTHTNVILTPAAPYAANAGYLIFEGADVVWAEEKHDAAVFNKGGDVVVIFKPASPGLYVLNFTILSYNKSPEFKITVDQNPAQTVPLKFSDDPTMLAVPLQVTKGNALYSIKIWSGTHWGFFSCEVLTAQ